MNHQEGVAFKYCKIAIPALKLLAMTLATMLILTSDLLQDHRSGDNFTDKSSKHMTPAHTNQETICELA